MFPQKIATALLTAATLALATFCQTATAGTSFIDGQAKSRLDAGSSQLVIQPGQMTLLDQKDPGFVIPPGQLQPKPASGDTVSPESTAMFQNQAARPGKSALSSDFLPDGRPRHRHAVLIIVGDLMAHIQQIDAAVRVKGRTKTYDFWPQFEATAPLLRSADLAIGNFETTIAGARARYSGYPMFNAPDEFAAAVKKAGFDLLSTANNHCMDRRVTGLIRTKTVLRRMGLKPFGTRVSSSDVGTQIVEADGIRFGFAACTYGTNGIRVPDGQNWVVPYIDEARFRREAASLHRSADIVIAMPHMGIEYQPLPPATVRATVHQLLNAGFDWVLASHPHVVQPFERLTLKPLPSSKTARDGIVAWSLGNFISSQRTHPRDVGAMLKLEVEKLGTDPARLTRASVCPTWVQYHRGGPIRTLPMAMALTDPKRWHLNAAEQARLKSTYVYFVTRILHQPLPKKPQLFFDIALPGKGPSYLTPKSTKIVPSAKVPHRTPRTDIRASKKNSAAVSR